MNSFFNFGALGTAILVVLALMLIVPSKATDLSQPVVETRSLWQFN